MGPTVGPYEIIGPLARGGMAEVWLARWSRMGAERLVVIKRLLPWLADDPEIRAMFADEIRLCATLDHPGIVHTYDVGEWEGLPFLVLEFVDGASLDRLAAEGARLTPAEAVAIAVAVAEALQFAHSRQPSIVHRDVSPSNILVDRDGRVRLADFGIAKVEGRARTMAGTLKGKLAYLAPEQISGGQTLPASDQYALGLVLFELLTGRPGLPGDSDAEILTAAAAGRWNRDDPAWDALDADLRAIVARALDTSPEHRWSDVRAFARELEAWAARRALGNGRDRLAARITDRPRDTRPTAMRASESGAHQGVTALVPATEAPRRGSRRMAALLVLNILGLAGAWWAFGATPDPAVPPASDHALPEAPAVRRAAPSQKPSPADRPPAAPPKESPADPAPVSRPPAYGRLTIQVTPWAHVDLGDGTTRTTPIIGERLPVGRHRIRLWNPDLNWSRVLTLSLTEGAEERILLGIDPPAQRTPP